MVFRRIAYFFAVVLLLSLTSIRADAAVRITFEPGGRIGPYIQGLWELSSTGEVVMIDGMCMSACTMLLGIIPEERICITPRAKFGFHAAWMSDGNGRRVKYQEGTDILMSVYPEHIIRWIESRGGLARSFKYLQGRELASMYPRCPAHMQTRPWIHRPFM